MKDRIFEIAIGSLVILIAVVFGVFAWNKVYSISNGGTYELNARFEKSGNLKRGDMVTIAGVNVGSIDKVNINPDSFMVHISFNIQNDVKLAKDSIAEVLQAGLMGGTYLAITPGSQKDHLLKNNGVVTQTKDNKTVEDIISSVLSGSLNK